VTDHDDDDDDDDTQLLMCGREGVFIVRKWSSHYERFGTAGIQHSGNYTCHLQLDLLSLY
jgi:hypothetical protein